MRAWTRGEEEALVIIEAPPREDGIATLRVGQNLWNYLPRIARTIRVPPSTMLGSWMGTDFTNDDLVKESSLLEDFTSRWDRRSDSPAGWWLLLDVKPGVVGRWSRIELLVSDERLPVEERHFDRKGRLARTMTFDEMKVLGGRRLPAHLTLVPTDTVGQRTEMRYLDLQFDITLPDDTFSLAATRTRQEGRTPMTMWRMAWRNLWRNRRRTALALAAIGLSVTLVLALHGMLRAYR